MLTLGCSSSNGDHAPGLRALLVAVPPVDEGLPAGLRPCLRRQPYL